MTLMLNRLAPSEQISIQPAKQTRSLARLDRVGEMFVRSLSAMVAPGYHNRLFNAGGLGYAEFVHYGQQIRDEWMHEFAILPGAINSYLEVATSREWMVIGPPRLAARAVEKLHRSYYTDRMGIQHHGWDLVFKQMCKDWLTIGRCAFAAPIGADSVNYRGDIEYLDTARLFPVKTSVGAYWQYTDPENNSPRDFLQSDVLFNDCEVSGANGIPMGKVFWLLPIARLEWYMREHMVAKLDGRKIRDIFFVEDDSMVEAVENALTSALALAEGHSFNEYGLPVVSLNRMGITAGASKVEDAFARMGLSEMPEALDPQALEFRLANEISSVLGLSLRYFWTDSNGSTNRSVEQIGQERQSVQGPSFFVRSIERLINRSTLFFSSPGKVRFKFEDEIDSASRQRAAETFKTRAEGFQILYNLVSPQMMPQVDAVTGATTMVEPERMNPDMMDPRSIISFMERDGLLTTDVTLPEMVTQEEYALRSVDNTLTSDPLNEGEVVMDQEGRIIERRRPVFPRPKSKED